MGNEYKKIVLLKGLEVINDYHFNIIKSLLAHDLQLTKKMQEEYNRIMIADLMEEKFQGVACVNKLIELFKDIKDLKKDIIETLRRAKSKVAKQTEGKKTPMKRNKQNKAGPATPIMTKKEGQKRTNTVKQDAITKKKKISEEESQPPCSSGASTSAAMDHPQLPQLSSPTRSSTSLNENQEQQAQCQASTKKHVLQKGPLIVMVLKATEPFKYESTEKDKNRMFHATVVTENKFFQVKVFNTNLKEKFTPRNFIAIIDYFECKGLLEINEVSSVSEVGPDHKFEVPTRIIKRAKETPKIDNLQKQASGTLVYGLFRLNKKKVNIKNTIYEIQDDTGKMEVVGNGKWHNIQCKEGDKLKLFCFQLRTIDYKLKLICGIHSLIKVTRVGKPRNDQ